jgi:hypothetical protein
MQLTPTVGLTFVLFGIGSLFSQTWDREVPRLTWQTRNLTLSEAKTLLGYLCADGVKEERWGNEVHFSCVPRKGGEATGITIPARRFDPRVFTPAKPAPGGDHINFTHVDRVIYGHFLSPTSEDAAVAGWGGETHPEFWGGTLLLTKTAAGWRPVWYRSAVISRYCTKVAISGGREILLCEEQDGGMGHSFHILYSLDLTAPRTPRDAAMLVADTYVLQCDEQQRQSIAGIDAPEAPGSLFRVLLDHGRGHLRTSERQRCATGDLDGPTIPTSRYHIEFTMEGSYFKPTPESLKILRTLGSVRPQFEQ